MCENVFCKGSETIFTNKAFRLLTGLRHYKLLDAEMYDESMSVRVSREIRAGWTVTAKIKRGGYE